MHSGHRIFCNDQSTLFPMKYIKMTLLLLLLLLLSCSLCDPIDDSPPGSRPWDSPGKNTGVGCHFLLQCRKVKSESEVAQSCPTPSDPMDCMQPTRLLRPWDFPGKTTGVGCHCLLQDDIKIFKKISLDIGGSYQD